MGNYYSKSYTKTMKTPINEDFDLVFLFFFSLLNDGPDDWKDQLSQAHPEFEPGTRWKPREIISMMFPLANCLDLWFSLAHK